MYGVIIEKGPKNWQIYQQKEGYADIDIAGRVVVESEISTREDAYVIVWVSDEQTGARIIKPVFIKPDDQNCWKTTLRVPVGGLYRIDTCLRFKGIGEKRGDRIFHVGVGDIFVITGQSNAVGVGKDAVNDPPDPAIHMFRLCGNWDMAVHPLHDSTRTEFELNQEQVQTGHSPWLNFAKILHLHLGYPIGLIPATKGGIPLSCWDRNDDGVFFENMLDILKAADCGGIRGILWYQGCQDTSQPDLCNTYYDRFRRVCRDFESVFFENVPILTVQLNKMTCTGNKNTEDIGREWARIREAQRRAMNEIPNVFMTPSIDCPVCDGIHNASPSNMAIGERIANLALKYIYGRDIICDAPDIEKAVKEGSNKIRLYFKYVYGHLFSDLNSAENMMFVAEDKHGTSNLIDYSCNGDNTILLTFDREIGLGCVGCKKHNDTGLMPYDVYSYLPIIPFDDIPVTEE